MRLESIGYPANANSVTRSGGSSDFPGSLRVTSNTFTLKEDLNLAIESMWRAGFALTACEKWVSGALERAERSHSQAHDYVTDVGIFLVETIAQLDRLDENRSSLGKFYLFNSLQPVLSATLDSKSLDQLQSLFEGISPATCYEALKALSFCSTALRSNQPFFPAGPMLKALETLVRSDYQSDSSVAAVAELYEACEQVPKMATMGNHVLLNDPRQTFLSLVQTIHPSTTRHKFIDVGLNLYENLISKDEPYRTITSIIGEFRDWMQLAERYSEHYPEDSQRHAVTEIPGKIIDTYLKNDWSLVGVFSEGIAPPMAAPNQLGRSKFEHVKPFAFERYLQRLEELLERNIDLRLARTYLQDERKITEPEWNLLQATSAKKLFEYHNLTQKTFAEYLGAFTDLGASATAVFKQKAAQLLALINKDHFSRLDEVASAFEEIFEATTLTDAITSDSSSQVESMRKLAVLINFDDRPLAAEDPEKAHIIKNRTFKETIRIFRGLHRIHHGFSVYTDMFRSLPDGLPCDFIRFANAVKAPKGEFGYLNASTHNVSPGRGFFLEGVDISRCFYAGRGRIPYQDFLLAWPEHAKAFQLLPKLKLFPIRGLWMLSCEDSQMQIAGVNMSLVIQNEHAFRDSFDFSSSAMLVPSNVLHEFIAPYRRSLGNDLNSAAKFDPKQLDLTKSPLSLSQLRRMAEARGLFTVAVSHTACIGGGLCQGFPINRGPFHGFEGNLNGVRVRDGMGHPHKIQIGLQHAHDTTLKINRDLQEAHDSVYAVSETYLRLFDLFNLTFAAWSRGSLLNSPKSDSLLMIEKCRQYHLAILDRKIDPRRVADDVPLLVFRNPINPAELERTFIDPADLSLNELESSGAIRKQAYFRTDRNDQLDDKSIELWQSQIVGRRFHSWYTWPVMMNRREFFETIAGS
jgi:hypothetical protein